VNPLADVNPVFIDLETRSCCDLPEKGGHNYAADPTTRLLTASWSAEKDVFHLWLPGADELPPVDYVATHLSDCEVHVGPEIPGELLALIETGRPWAAHNAWSFDEPVWSALYPEHEPQSWIDTYPLALSVGLPGGINAIGQRLWGDGKYEQGGKALLDASRCKNPDLCDAANVPVALQILVGRYNVQDVRLLGWLWEELVRTYPHPETELQVMRVHRTVNDRGVRIDRPLLKNLIRLSDECRGRAVGTIGKLTDGKLSSQSDLNSRNKVLDWLGSQGLDLGKNLRKTNKTGEEVSSLARGIVEKFVNAHDETNDEQGDDESDDLGPEARKNLPKILKVLELRSAALRVTHGKLDAALHSLNADDRVRSLYVYWGAHTGRWAARRIQPHNLPKAKDGINKLKPGGTWRLFDLYDSGRLTYDEVAALLPEERFLTPDDAVSAMIRGLLLPDVGRVLATADLAQIECRVLNYLAGQDDVMDTFWKGEDPYIKLGPSVFGPYETWPACDGGLKKHPYRHVLKIIELGCGYGLGVDQFALYAASSGVDLEAVGTDAQTCVEGYRNSHPKVAGVLAGEFNRKKFYRNGFWHRLNDAAVFACMHPGRTATVGRIEFFRRQGDLLVRLPSGRFLTYRAARVEPTTPKFLIGSGRKIDAVVYASPRFGRVVMYPGKWAENVVQAVSRDGLANSIVNLEASSMPVCLHVHDEAGSSVHEGQNDDFMRVMTTPADWLTDFPYDAEGGLSPRYSKSPPPGVKEQVWRNGKRLS